jgi:hypothetical protein
MLRCTMIQKDVLEVEQAVMGFDKTEYTYFYTNLKDWTDLTNPMASRQRDPVIVARKLTEAEILWCTQHYLPKAKGV